MKAASERRKYWTYETGWKNDVKCDLEEREQKNESETETIVR